MSTAREHVRTASRQGWQLAELQHDRLVFTAEGGLRNALKDGFFYVKQPAGLDLSAGDRFARSFYLPAEKGRADPYRGYQQWTPKQLGPHQGYFCRDADQTEQFFLESAWWDRVYPAALIRQAQAMRDFAISIQRAVLTHLDLPREVWQEATGHSLTPQGTHTLTFNHFRPEVAARGLNIHKDSGWVTVLRSTEPGLEVDRDGDWHPIDPIPGTFIVNFGCAMEILTRSTTTPVAAVAHRVVRQACHDEAKPDRFSYALFVDSSLDNSICPGLFTYEPATGLRLETSFETFLDDILDNTYQQDTTGLY
ncbi:2OG-Fe(II) oxygenase family protein [Streptomyces botrytidirepellens]|uniref:Isopenicillin N synthase family oxygenase n=1 Tax=Streptomyces botrytidirepellens TaxID=2486417 RepID=A0A3M8W0P1_9ACTN|nr:2OG-Fe(II) oxygenase family protein [Streptomyces botrytidirepellens]RNG23564.1 isopenicillin N synthase family oxygenase [Streptomyces botrytidirepellens]